MTNGEPSFIVKLTFQELRKAEKNLKRKKIPYTIFIHTGYFPKEGARYFVYYGTCWNIDHDEWCGCNIDDDNWFGTTDNIYAGDDGVMADIIRPNKPVTRIPNINEILKVKKFKIDS